MMAGVGVRDGKKSASRETMSERGLKKNFPHFLGRTETHI
jgi:hypothetical protein